MSITSKDIYDFHQWFSSTFGDRLASRYHTFYQALMLALVRGAKHLVETGTARETDSWAGDGESTYVFGAFARRYGCRLWTCDVEEAHIATARRLTAPFQEHIEYVVSDSVEFLRNFDRPIDLLYLDSYDFELEGDPNPPQDHALREVQAALHALHSQSVVLADDCGLPHGGKGGKAIPFLLEKEWQLFGLGYQTLVAQPSWAKPSEAPPADDRGPAAGGPARQGAEPDRSLRAFAEELIARELAAQALSVRVDKVSQQAAQGEGAELRRQVQELARENESKQREIAEFQRRAQELERENEAVERSAAEQIRLLTQENEAKQREAAELHKALEEAQAQVDLLSARVNLLLGREQELREMYLEAHDQLLRRDEEIQAVLAMALQQNAPAVSGAVAANKGSLPGKHLPYQLLLHRIREVVRGSVSPEARVLVISKGDGELLKLAGRPGWHFPQNEKGVWAGYNPADSAAAIAHLEELRAKGADFLLLPATALWWLEHYAEFREHLESRYREVVRQDDTCVIFALREPAEPEQRQYRQLIQRVREAVQSTLPAQARVLVVSKGDEELLKLGDRKAGHFPQAEGGAYAGHHPADSAEAIAHLEDLRGRGAQFLLFPSTALWWLEHYAEFRRHLEARYPAVLRREDTCLVFALQDNRGGNGHQTEGTHLTTGVRRAFGVNIVGPLASEKGAGEAGRSLIRCLEAVNIPYVLNDFADPSSVNRDRTYTHFSDDNPYGINLLRVEADSMPAFLEQKGEAYLRDRYNIGYWFWELSDFPKEWAPCFQHFHEIWVATQFVLDAVSRSAPVPVVRIPCTLPEHLEVEPRDRSYFGLPQGPFVFLFLFDFMSCAERKNPLGLIRAFKNAFRDQEEVRLVLKCCHSDSFPAELQALKEACGGGNVYLLDRVLSREETNTLLQLSDCYVSLHRSEGFGLPLAEAMSMAKPVIATGYSGNLDFMTPANSFPVRYRLVELQQDYQPFHYKKGCVWADPDLDHAAELMRFVYENRKSAEQVGRKARQDVLQSLHPRAVGRLIKERLSRLAALGKVAAPPSAADGQKDVPAIADETEGNPKRGIGNPK